MAIYVLTVSFGCRSSKTKTRVQSCFWLPLWYRYEGQSGC